MERKHDPSLTGIAKFLRKNMTPEERHLWYDFLRTYPVRFLRQRVIGGFVVDFYCAQAKLIIEVDGSQHYSEEGIVHDHARTEVLEKFGLAVLRVTNTQVKREFESVCQWIDEEVKRRL